MKNLTNHLILVQAALVSFILLGCSSINTTKEPSVRDAVAAVITAVEITGDDNVDVEPSLALVGGSNNHFSARSSSVWISRMTVIEPAAQKVQRHALQSNDKLDIESMIQSQLNERETKRPEGLNVSSYRHHTVSVVDALEELFSGSNTTREPNVNDATAEDGNDYNIVAVVF